jgi:hypothetical protein
MERVLQVCLDDEQGPLPVVDFSLAPAFVVGVRVTRGLLLLSAAKRMNRETKGDWQT